MTFTEVIKIKDGQFYNLAMHLNRLSRTVQFFFRCDIDLSSLSESAIPNDMKRGVVKCRIVYSDRILVINFEQYNYRNIRKLALVYDDNINYSHKFENRSLFDHLLEQRGDADDILIVRNGLITDTSFTNVVLRHNDGGLFTPESYLLPGTKRQMLLDSGLIGQRRIAVDDLSQYNEIYLINAMIDLEDRIVAQLA